MTLYTEDIITGFDVNTTTSVTSSFNIKKYLYFGFAVSKESGTISSSVLDMQCSEDGSNWRTMVDRGTPVSVTGTGSSFNHIMVAPFIRIKLSTVEGTAGSAKITIMCKG